MGKLIISEKVQFELGMEGYSLAEPAMQDGPPHEIKSMSRGGQGGAGEQAEGQHEVNHTELCTRISLMLRMLGEEEKDIQVS